MPPVIRVENLSKSYNIQHNAARSQYRTLQETITQIATSPLRRLRGQRNGRVEKFWALKDVNLEVQQGEVLGIIGRNGAGKSTLLKVLSRITAPTTGRIELRGRVGSLLEVGTGFHPELTGRENIYLNGSILGMHRREIQWKFDEIVDFSGVEKFLDTPVKRYSSGMYVRLAFAVAAHLEPEILIVDEVLAVGDAEFQKKCLGKMEEVSKCGRTVLFVSHNMVSIARLCNQGLLLQGGQKVFFGGIHELIARYNENIFNATSEKVWPDGSHAPGDHSVRLRAVRLLTNSNELVEGAIDINEGFAIEIEYELLDVDGDRIPIAAINLINENGIILFASSDFRRAQAVDNISDKNVVKAVCHIPGYLLAEGRFSVLAAMVSYNPNIVHAIAPDAVSSQAIERTCSGVRGECAQGWPGLVRPRLEWS
jgi:lipopolysaccharide transport system ATP-binding protein